MAAAPPTRWVGESGGEQLRVAALERVELAHRARRTRRRRSRGVEDVVAVVVVLDLGAQLVDAQLGRRLSSASCRIVHRRGFTTRRRRHQPARDQPGWRADRRSRTARDAAQPTIVEMHVANGVHQGVLGGMGEACGTSFLSMCSATSQPTATRQRRQSPRRNPRADADEAVHERVADRRAWLISPGTPFVAGASLKCKSESGRSGGANRAAALRLSSGAAPHGSAARPAASGRAARRKPEGASEPRAPGWRRRAHGCQRPVRRRRGRQGGARRGGHPDVEAAGPAGNFGGGLPATAGRSLLGQAHLVLERARQDHRGTRARRRGPKLGPAASAAPTAAAESGEARVASATSQREARDPVGRGRDRARSCGSCRRPLARRSPMTTSTPPSSFKKWSVAVRRTVPSSSWASQRRVRSDAGHAQLGRLEGPVGGPRRVGRWPPRRRPTGTKTRWPWPKPRGAP